MKPRDFLNFFKTKSGKLVVFGAVFAAGLVIFGVIRKQHPSADDGIAVAPLSTNATDKPQVVQSVTRPMQVFSPPSAKPDQPQSHTTPTNAGCFLRIPSRNHCPMFRRIKPICLRPSVSLPTARRALPARKN